MKLIVISLTQLYSLIVSKIKIKTKSQKMPLESAVVGKIVEQCVDQLCVQNDPVTLSAKMKILMENDYKTRGSVRVLFD